MQTVNIVGSCVLRDAIGFEEKKRKIEYKVNKFIQSNHLMTLNSPPLYALTDSIVEPEEMSQCHPVWYRWAKTNMDKSIFSILKQNPSDYFICGFDETAYNIVKLTSENYEFTYLSPSAFCGKFNEIFNKDKFSNLKKENIDIYEFIQTDEGKALLESCLEFFEEEILKIYPSNKIICIYYDWGNSYLSADGYIIRFNNQEPRFSIMNQLINYCANHFVKRVSPQIIRIPSNAICDALHIWKLGPQHFISDVYEYLYQCYDVCMNDEISNKSVMLQQLYENMENFLAGYTKCCEAISFRQQEFKLYDFNVFTARIDIKLFGENAKYDIVEISDKKASVTQPAWFAKSGLGRVIESKAMRLIMKIKTLTDGKLNIWLRGKDVRKKDNFNERFSQWVDYTSFIVNDNQLMKQATPTWHDKPFNHAMNVYAGDIITVNVEWQCHSDNRTSIDNRPIPKNLYLITDIAKNNIIRHNIPIGIKPSGNEFKSFTLNGNDIIENKENGTADDISKFGQIQDSVRLLFNRIDTDFTKQLADARRKGFKTYYYNPKLNAEALTKQDGIMEKFIAISVKYPLLMLLCMDSVTMESCKKKLVSFIEECKAKYSAQPQILARITEGIPRDILQNCDFVISEGKIEDIVASDYAINFGAKTVMADDESLFKMNNPVNVCGSGTV